jgi:hypothetical protein
MKKLIYGSLFLALVGIGVVDSRAIVAHCKPMATKSMTITA